MNILFFDTETTGMPNWRGPIDSPDQPCVVQLAMMLDHNGRTVTTSSMLVRGPLPSCNEAFEVHEITEEMRKDYGYDEVFALQRFFGLASIAERIVAHNIKFDTLMMSFTAARNGMLEDFKRAVLIGKHFCTMTSLTGVMKLPGPYGYKWPKLEEAYKWMFGIELKNAHDALVDTQACRRVYYEMEKRRIGGLG